MLMAAGVGQGSEGWSARDAVCNGRRRVKDTVCGGCVRGGVKDGVKGQLFGKESGRVRA